MYASKQGRGRGGPAGQRPGGGGRSARASTVRLFLLAVGLISLVTYIWIVLFVHPAHVAASAQNTGASLGNSAVGAYHAQVSAEQTSRGTPPKAWPPLLQRRHSAPPLQRREEQRGYGVQAGNAQQAGEASWQQSQAAGLADLLPRQPPGSPPALPPPPPVSPPPPPRRDMRSHPFQEEKYRIWKLPAVDPSPRCKASGICDGNHECRDDDKLGCVTDALERKMHVRNATRWTWKGYKCESNRFQ
jgi:hypothetical protein